MPVSRVARFAIGIAVALLFALASAQSARAQMERQQPATLSGTIISRRGVVPGATVEIVNVTDGRVRAVPTDANGVFTFVDVPPGPFSVKVTKAGFHTLTAIGTLNDGASRDLGKLVLVDDRRPAGLSGTITDSRGAVPAATVEIADVTNGRLRSVSTDERGVFTFVDVLPGRYAFTVTKTGFRTITATVTLSGGQVRDLGTIVLIAREPATRSTHTYVSSGHAPQDLASIIFQPCPDGSRKLASVLP